MKHKQGTLPRQIVGYMIKNGSISAREAMLDLDITSASFSRRVCDLEEMGYVIIRERKKHLVTAKRYTRYSIQDTKAGTYAEAQWPFLQKRVLTHGLQAA